MFEPIQRPGSGGDRAGWGWPTQSVDSVKIPVVSEAHGTGPFSTDYRSNRLLWPTAPVVWASRILTMWVLSVAQRAVLRTAHRFRTGIGPLDRKLGGGIPAGSVVALSAQPASQSELLLYQLAGQGQTLYLTTQRRTASVRRAIESSEEASLADVHVHSVDPANPGPEIADYADRFETPLALVVDPMDAVEAGEMETVRSTLRTVQQRVAETESIAVLHCLDGRRTDEARDVTTYMADLVFDLQTHVDDDTVENRLSVPKFRGGRALTDALRLELTDRVVVDNSRDIA